MPLKLEHFFLAVVQEELKISSGSHICKFFTYTGHSNCGKYREKKNLVSEPMAVKETMNNTFLLCSW